MSTITQEKHNHSFIAFLKIVHDSLNNNHIHSHVIKEEDGLVTIQSYNGRIASLRMENVLDKDLNVVNDFNVELFKPDGHEIELIGRKYRDNPQDIADIIIRFFR